MQKLLQFERGNLSKKQDNGKIIKFRRKRKIKLWKLKDSKKFKNKKILRSGKNKRH